MKMNNGLRIVNFSSPHSFIFTTGEVLPGCSPERARSLMLNPIEIEHQNNSWVDIELRFEMTIHVQSQIDLLNADKNIDIILVPLPIMTALKQGELLIGKCRSCRVADRIAKTIYSDRFCI